MGPICQECNNEQVHVIALENTDGLVSYACEHCGARNTLIELSRLRKVEGQASDPTPESAHSGEHEQTGETGVLRHA